MKNKLNSLIYLIGYYQKKAQDLLSMVMKDMTMKSLMVKSKSNQKLGQKIKQVKSLIKIRTEAVQELPAAGENAEITEEAVTQVIPDVQAPVEEPQAGW